MLTDQIRPITSDQYTALLQPVKAPTPEELFEFQRQRLADKKLAPIGMFDHFRKRLPSGLFLLVPPQPASVDKLNWNKLMSRIELSGKTGRNHLEPMDLTDEIEVPKVPTMLVDVEDGRGRRNTKPSLSLKAIPAEGRSAYHLWRGYIHVLLFPSVLDHHYLELIGSRNEVKRIPGLCLCGGWPVLDDHRWGDDADQKRGAPSCGRVES
ncbi:MAG: hypothetical protein A2849_03595 [Candidatus Taylorbacteria bacterium RIFCSPHIGHO2_01_FULL_51_15]|uniref:Uncharacterized protein n=1 Tax=Candidatus Taylorbacteria bacterium RIFCSPHIGHO2_01_FULL_51_15 TaxID=1802304 RepID=A0A1G2MFB3_9BACT|nr:MAG: hypothetical protein A2849_03595 [Candidatus Taylorbacteria bacterium RIFCSPHIGHO2_01_FULL_51_15]